MPLHSVPLSGELVAYAPQSLTSLLYSPFIPSLATGGYLSSRPSTLTTPPGVASSQTSTHSLSRLGSPVNRKARSNIKLALILGAEKILGALLGQRREPDTRPEYLEVHVRALLGLARLAVVLQHCITAYQLSLQGLRLLQGMEEGGCLKEEERGAAALRGVDLRLWMECRYWMSRSVVGMGPPPGGGSLLLEVGEYCEECGQHGEVELVAEMEFTAAEHALMLLPCQLQAAQQHSQASGCPPHACHIACMVHVTHHM